ncbi:MAG: stage II sporulation protein P [Methylocystaceae bacterium]
MKNRFAIVLFISMVLWAGLATLARAETELPEGKYYTIVNEKGQAIDYTGIKVMVGDEYISPDNTRYRVEKVSGLTAYARSMGKVQLAARPLNFASWSLSFGYRWLTAKGGPIVGVYSTHTDESYKPSDGKDSIDGHGGVIKVASVLTKGLSGKGLKVIHDDAKHDPHDANAYNRSRKTASRLMRKGAFSLIDVHRDAAPAQQYNSKVQGKNVTRIKLVVGRSNPKMASNMEFAKRMKAHIDKDHPGLSAGIFVGHGNYNQDLTPRAMLIEVGGNNNTREQAQQAVSLFATSVPEVLGSKASGKTASSGDTGVKGALTSTSNQRQQKTNYGTTIGIVLALAVVAGAFFMLNKGKVK